MWRDPIVEEIHAIREQIARECEYDLRKIVDRLKSKEARGTGRVVQKEDLKNRRELGGPPQIDRKDAA